MPPPDGETRQEASNLGKKIITEAPFPAKVTPPKVGHAVARPRLFEHLQSSPCTWMSWVVAPAGAGKTTFVADYLHNRAIPVVWYNCDEGDADPATFFYYMREAARRVLGPRASQLPLLQPEYVIDIELFARRFFESLSRLLMADATSSDRAVLVFDNFQDVPLSMAVQKILMGGPEGLCEGVTAIVISREEPPAALARIQAGERMARVGFDDLRFTLDETRELVKMRQPQVADAAMQQMHELTQGWVAGLALILAGLNHRELADHAPLEAGIEAIMSYFAEEIFAHMEPEWRQFLLKTSLLSTVNVSMANRLVETDAGQQILSRLCRRHLFIKRLDGEGLEYQYHPLLREFLLFKARSLYSPEELNHLRRSAARLLEEAQQVEDAARLYAEAGDSTGLARMAREHAESLLAQGRSQTLAFWLAAIAGDPALDPWIHFWRGFCVYTQDLAAARQHLQSALDGFVATNDRKGIYLAWSGLVDSWSFGFDDWRPLEQCIALFEELQAADPVFPDAATELIVVSRLLTALAVVRMDQPALVERWMERMAVLLESPAQVNRRVDALFAMSVYHLWRGAYEKNSVLLEKAQAELRQVKLPPFIAIRVQLMVAVHSWITGDYAAAHRASDEGLALAHESGIQAFNSLLWSFKVTADFAQGKLEQGASSLAAQLDALIGPERALDVYFYHVNAAWYALLMGQPARAHEHLLIMGRKVERIGNRYMQALWHLGMAQAEFLLERPEQAMQHTRLARNHGTATDSWVIQWYAFGVEAWQLLSQKREAEGLLALHHALTLGQRHGYIHLEMFLPDVMRFLFIRALEEKIQTEYVRSIIRTVKLAPPLDGRDRSLAIASLIHWPFRVRIRTLGHFEIRIQEELLTFSSKEKKKPLEMLKAIIALGGVDVSEDVLADQLWPDAEGDLAHKSLETTLSRLRKLLGSDSSVLYRSHRITLNPAECWVDCITLRQLLARLGELEVEQSVEMANHALTLCQGSFLPGETSLDCFSSYRERMREKQLRMLLWLGTNAECSSDWNRAAEHYHRAILIDPLGEEFYLRLMLCQRQLGNYSGAVRTYLRCEQSLRSGLEMEPSPETQALYRSLTNASRADSASHTAPVVENKKDTGL